mmetsp:Transcript_21470/g.67545  ORF Transcript_21470/g.67545 Transcript_21470/m.67545 type:complete len:216 (+) Transcript_21470:2716-3363(+)
MRRTTGPPHASCSAGPQARRARARPPCPRSARRASSFWMTRPAPPQQRRGTAPLRMTAATAGAATARKRRMAGRPIEQSRLSLGGRRTLEAWPRFWATSCMTSRSTCTAIRTSSGGSARPSLRSRARSAPRAVPGGTRLGLAPARPAHLRPAPTRQPRPEAPPARAPAGAGLRRGWGRKRRVPAESRHAGPSRTHAKPRTPASAASPVTRTSCRR